MQPTILVLGSGPIRIGQGIEFDYSCVHCMWALQKMGYRAIVINNNPETVSTDFDTGDGLYFEPVTFADVMKVIEHEKPEGVIVQFGGQTAINLAEPLHQAGVKIVGTSWSSIAAAEDRQKFDALMSQLGILRPAGAAVRSIEEARSVAAKVGFPVLVRPSFVLGGQAMMVCHSPDQLDAYYRLAEDANPGQPVLVDEYVLGTEAELDVISDGEQTLVPGIMEHIERAGVHSGDSMAVYPPVRLSDQVQAEMIRCACKLARALEIRGLMNIQFVVKDERAYVIEVNPRASRTVPYLSKITGLPMIRLATECAMGKNLADSGYEGGLWWVDPQREQGGYVIPQSEFEAGAPIIPKAIVYGVKAPVFSFQKLTRVEPSLGPEMKSTGEILGVDSTYEAALFKAFVASGININRSGFIVLTVNHDDRPEAVNIAAQLSGRGFRIACTPGTGQALQSAGIACDLVNKIQDGSPNLLDLISGGQVALMINTPSVSGNSTSEAATIRRACIEAGIPCITSIDTAAALVQVLEYFEKPELASCKPLHEYLQGPKAPALGSMVAQTR
ncbi:MAG: carbamoyl-phosphate synthase large subunit [Chthonomonas sp.]|nr:carbamoyl-phosphate synthase large subunit [Chthonomonas sp.]